MFKNEKFIKLLNSALLYEGMVVKGYTYNAGDFHTTNQEKLGFPKLRVGVIVRKFSQKYVKVQWRNSAGSDFSNQDITNEISIYDERNQKLLENLRGTNSYCMWVRRDSIKKFYKPKTSAQFDYQKIYQKHSKEKKDVEKKYFDQKKIAGLRAEIVKKILHEEQFTPTELILAPAIADLKIDILIKKHYSMDDCVPKEFKKVIKAKIFAQPDQDYPNLEEDFTKYQKNYQSNQCKMQREGKVRYGKK